MKKIMLLSTAILMFSPYAANAGSSFHFGFFVPQPVYVAPPRPVYVVEEYRPVYRNPYPRYNFEHNYWYYDDYDDGHHGHKQCRKRHHGGHKRHHRDDD